MLAFPLFTQCNSYCPNCNEALEYYCRLCTTYCPASVLSIYEKCSSANCSTMYMDDCQQYEAEMNGAQGNVNADQCKEECCRDQEDDLWKGISNNCINSSNNKD